MDGDSTLVNLLAGDGTLPPGVAPGDLMYFDGTNWISKTIQIPFNYTQDDVFENSTYDAIPDGCLLKTITVLNKTANPVNVVITTVSDSRELMNEAIDAHGELTLTLNMPFVAATSLIVSSPDWNHASIQLSINLEKLF